MRPVFFGQWTGHFPATSLHLSGDCWEIARQMGRIVRRINFGNADGDPAVIPAAGRWQSAGNAAGESADAESFASEGVRLPMLKGGRLHLKLANHFVQ